MLWWLSLGPDLSCSKAQRGSTVNWFRAEISVDAVNTAKVVLLEKFIAELLGNIDVALGTKQWDGDVNTVRGTTEVADLRVFAGRASWAAGHSSVFWSNA